MAGERRVVTAADGMLLGAALALTVMASLIAASEAALSSFSRARAQTLVDEGHHRASRLLRMVEDLPSHLNTALFVRLACELTTVTLVGLVAFAHVEATWAKIVALAGGMLLVSFLLWGVLPRTLGRQHADKVALAAAVPLTMAGWVLGPLVRLLILVGNAITPGRGFAEGPFSSEAELREAVDHAAASELLEADNAKMLTSVMDLGDTVVRTVMVPRTDMVYIDQDQTLRQAMSVSLRTGFSRIPVITDNSLDRVVGILHVKDVMKRVHDLAQAAASERVAEVMREPMWTPESKPVDELLKEMQLMHSHMAIVVDEFGGTAGLVTIEDILEEIVGEIVDEYDHEEPLWTELAPGRYRVSSRMAVEDLGELFDVELSDDDVETVGGLVTKLLGRLPTRGASVHAGGIELTADGVLGPRRRIATFLATRVDTDAGTDAAATMLSGAGADSKDRRSDG